MRKLILFLFIGLFMISFVSAFDWTDGKVTLYWKLDNSTGIVSDITGNGNDGINNGATRGGAGILGNSFSFDGINDWVNTTNGSWSTGSSWSINIWVNGTDTSTLQYLFDIAGTDRNIIRTDATNLSMNYNDNSFDITFGLNTNIFDGSWHHLVFTTDGTTGRTYVDGESIVNRTVNVAPLKVTSGAVLGAIRPAGASNNFNGSIDEVGIWNRTLTVTEVLELYNSGSGLTFQGGLGNVSIDSTSPVDDFDTTNSNITFQYNLTTAGSFNLTNVTLFVFYNTNGTLFRNITNLSLSGKSQNISNEIINIPVGMFYWNIQVFAETISSVVASSTSENRTFKVTSFTVGGSNYSTHTFETSTENFIQNITTESGFTVTSATLIYNGTNLGEATTTNYGAGLFGFSKTSTIPIGIDGFTTENRSFFWSITLTEISTGTQSIQNTSTFQQNVSELLFEQCGTLTEIFVNFTATNETNLSGIDFIMDGTFNFWLGDGDLFKNISLDSNTEVANYTFCSNNGNLTVSSIVNVQSTGFDERTFFLNEREYNNVTITNETLMLLETGIGTSVIVQVTDPGLAPLEGIFVNVYRFYPGTNEYIIIEAAKTDEFGQFVAKLIEPNTIKYQFEFLNAEGTVLKRTTDVAIACRLTICLIRFVIEDTTDDFERFDNVTDFQYTLSFSNVTNTFIYTWNDITGDSITSRLLVEKIQFNETVIVCDITSTSLSSSLTCDVSSLGDGNYRAQVFRTESGKNQRRIDLLDIEIGGTVGIFGKEGLFWGFFLVFTMVAVGSYNPTVGILLYMAGFIGLGSIGVISMTAPVFFAMILIGVLFIWALRS